MQQHGVGGSSEWMVVDFNSWICEWIQGRRMSVDHFDRWMLDDKIGHFEHWQQPPHCYDHGCFKLGEVPIEALRPRPLE